MVQHRWSRHGVATLIAMLVAMLAAAAAPSAHAANVLVQGGEYTYSDHGRGGDGLDLIAHRYTSSGGTTGSITVAAGSGTSVPFRSVTVFDLDRDGRADAELLIEPDPVYVAEVTTSWYRLTPDRTFTDAGRRCVQVDPTGLTPFQTGPDTVDLSGGILSVNAPVTWPAELAAQAAYAPRIATAALLRTGGYVYSNEELPDAAGSSATSATGTECGSGALELDPAKGSDRGFTGAPTLTQDLPDPADAGADIRAVRLEQWETENTISDMTNNPNTTTREAFHPTDLVVEFPADGEIHATGWFAPGRSYAQGQQAPIGMVSIDTIGGDPDHVRVELWRAASMTGFASNDRVCYPNSLGASGTDNLVVTLPLTTVASGNRALRLVADALVGQQPFTSGKDVASFRWAFAATAPAERDVVPDTAGQVDYGKVSLPGAPCDYPGGTVDDGTYLRSDRLALFKDAPVLDTKLIASNDKPNRGETISLSVDPHTNYSYAFDVADGRLAAQTAAFSQTAAFQQSYTARAAVFDDDGVVNIVEQRVSVANRPPVARIAINGEPAAAEYGLGDDGTELLFSGADSDDPDGTPIAAYAWTLTPKGGGTPITATGPSLRHRFTATGDWTVELRVEDPEGEPATVTAALKITSAPPPPPAPTRPPVMTLDGPASVELGVDGTATATFDATGSRGANADPALTFQWDLDGDGRFETSTGAVPRATARFTTRGARTITVLGVDRYGNTATARREIAVRNYLDADCGASAIVRTVSYGPVRATGCFARVERPTAGTLWIASGRLNLNGLIITGARGSTAVPRTFSDCDAEPCRSAQAAFNDPRNGIALVLDPYDGRLASNAPVALTAEGTEVNLPLSLSPIDITLPFSPREDGFIVRVPPEAALFGFPLVGEAEVRFPAGGETDVRVTVDGSGLLDGVSGDVHVRAIPSRGVVLDHLRLGFEEGLLRKVLRIKRLGLEYDRADQLWAGDAIVVLPAGRPLELGAGAAVQHGRFKSVHGSVFGLNRHLGKGIFLQGIRFGVAVDPLDLSGGISLSAGPALKVKGSPRTLLRADGDFRLTFPSPAAPYTLFSLNATLSVLDDFQIANSTIRFTDTGFTEVRTKLGGEYGIGYFEAQIGGWFTATKFNAYGDADVGLLIAGRKVGLLGAHAVASTKGVAACGEIPVINLGGGIGYRWGEEVGTFDGCDLSPYSEARPADAPAAMARAAAADRAPTVEVAEGLPSLALRVQGRGGAPDVKLVREDGTVAFTTHGDELTAERLVIHDAAHATTSILWKAPPAGRYAIVAADGSVPLADVAHAAGRAAPKVRATVSGSGPRRTLRWSVTPALAPDQRLVLTEAAGGRERELLDTRQTVGQTTFTPPAGGDVREIRAMVTAEGLGRPAVTVARYRAPRLVLPDRPRHVVATRGHRTVRVRFAAPSTGGPATSYRVKLIAGDRILARTITRPRAVTFSGIPSAQAARIYVRGMDPSGVGGPGTTTRLRPGAARSGPVRRDDVRPRSVRVTRRASGTLAVRWHNGRQHPRSYRVVVRIGTRTYRLSASPRRPRVTVRRAPRGRVHVTVTPLRFGGGRGPSAHL